MRRPSPALALLALLVTGAALAEEAAPDPPDPSPAVEVLQRLPFSRAGRFAVTPFVAIVPNDPFVTYFPAGLRVGHFFNESFQSEVSVAYLDALAVDRDLRDRVDSEVRLQDQQVARAQWSASWTLINAKGRFLGDDVIYLRGHLLGGFGAVLVRDPDDALDARPEGLFGLGLETHVTDTGSLRVELRQAVFQRALGGALLPTEISFGYAFYLGGPLEGAR